MSVSRVDMRVPVSVGEVADKLTILEIKLERIVESAKLANIRAEYDALSASFAQVLGEMNHSLARLMANLKEVNEQLWVIEDDIRECERRKLFDAEFVRLARAVYVTNDKRAEIKREINLLVGSAYVEEKSYAPYV